MNNLSFEKNIAFAEKKIVFYLSVNVDNAKQKQLNELVEKCKTMFEVFTDFKLN